jgi:hypothetical protein
MVVNSELLMLSSPFAEDPGTSRFNCNLPLSKSSNLFCPQLLFYLLLGALLSLYPLYCPPSYIVSIGLLVSCFDYSFALKPSCNLNFPLSSKLFPCLDSRFLLLLSCNLRLSQISIFKHVWTIAFLFYCPPLLSVISSCFSHWFGQQFSSMPS